MAGTFETLGVSLRREEPSLVSVSEGRIISVERGFGLSRAKAGHKRERRMLWFQSEAGLDFHPSLFLFVSVVGC